MYNISFVLTSISLNNSNFALRLGHTAPESSNNSGKTLTKK